MHISSAYALTQIQKKIRFWIQNLVNIRIVSDDNLFQYPELRIRRVFLETKKPLFLKLNFLFPSGCLDTGGFN